MCSGVSRVPETRWGGLGMDRGLGIEIVDREMPRTKELYSMRSINEDCEAI